MRNTYINTPAIMIRKSMLIITAILVIISYSCNKYDNAIADIEDRLEKIEGTAINSLEKQITEITSSIKDLEHVDYILEDAIFKLGVEVGDLEEELAANTAADAQTKKALQTEIDSINVFIAALQEKDTDLEKKITDLKEYVNSENSSMKEWANGTFATLEQYSAVQKEIAALKATIENYKSDIVAEYTKAIEDAISASEDSMKKWVNGLLAEGYYNIAQIDALLETLETGLSNAQADIAKSIEDQQAALVQAEKDLTAAYEVAIKKAIAENNGVINTAIADAIERAVGPIEKRLTDIEEKIGNIRKDLEDLKENFTRRIQSLTFLPQYSDGKVKMDYATGSTEVDLLVSPRELVQFISPSHLSAFMRITENPESRAAGNEYSLDLEITGKSDEGVLTLKITDTGNIIPATFWEGTKGAVLYIQINDGNNQVISQAIPMVAHSYVSGNNNINGFADGENFNGNVYEN